MRTPNTHPENNLGHLEDTKTGPTARVSRVLNPARVDIQVPLQSTDESTKFGPGVVVGECAGFRFLIDSADAHILSGVYLYVKPDKNTNYLVAIVPGARTKFRVHRKIMGAKPGQIVDHINGNGLDNRRCNLRLATLGQNVQNRAPNKGKVYKGIRFIAKNKRNPWAAIIKPQSGVVYLGAFDEPEKAARAYDAAAIKYFGEFARLNFPQPHTQRIPECPQSCNRNISRRNP